MRRARIENRPFDYDYMRMAPIAFVANRFYCSPEELANNYSSIPGFIRFFCGNVWFVKDEYYKIWPPIDKNAYQDVLLFASQVKTINELKERIRNKYGYYYYLELRKKSTTSLRKRVFLRDSYTCQYCGKSIPNGANGVNRYWAIDHILPVALLGETTERNLVCSCISCNMNKSAVLVPNNFNEICDTTSELYNLVIKLSGMPAGEHIIKMGERISYRWADDIGRPKKSKKK